MDEAADPRMDRQGRGREFREVPFAESKKAVFRTQKPFHAAEQSTRGDNHEGINVSSATLVCQPFDDRRGHLVHARGRCGSLEGVDGVRRGGWVVVSAFRPEILELANHADVVCPKLGDAAFE